jgi:colicin import membrane protein
MSIRPLIASYLLILCAVTIGCGKAPEPKAAPESSESEAAREAAENWEAAVQRAAERKADEQKVAAEKKAAEDKAAAEKLAADKKAADNSYVKVKVEVELRGVLTYTDEQITLSVVTPEAKKDQFEEVKWVLDFGDEKEMRGKAKGLDGKAVLVTGSAILRGIKSETVKEWERPGGGRPMFDQTGRPVLGTVEKLVTRSVLDLEPKVAVKSLVAATKD